MTTASPAAPQLGWRRRGQTSSSTHSLCSPLPDATTTSFHPPRRRCIDDLTRLQSCHIYIGRGHAKLHSSRSRWANPFAISRTRTRQECITLFRDYLRTRQDLLQDIQSLRGHVLVCHCTQSQQCHADVLRTMVIQQHAQQSGLPFAQYHDWETPAHERKRHHGYPTRPPTGSPLHSGIWASAAGLQPRRAAHLPLLSFEVHPGEAIHQLTTPAHPFAIPPPLTKPMLSAIEFSARPTHEVRAWRPAKFDEWRQRAIDL